MAVGYETESTPGRVNGWRYIRFVPPELLEYLMGIRKRVLR